MPNKTIYLPEELDEICRRLDLNLSQLVQKAIREYLHKSQDKPLEDKLEKLYNNVKILNIDWPKNYLEESRNEANER